MEYLYVDFHVNIYVYIAYILYGAGKVDVGNPMVSAPVYLSAYTCALWREASHHFVCCVSTAVRAYLSNLHP